MEIKEEEIKNNLSAKHEDETVPMPIAKLLIVVYVGTLFLVIMTQIISIYNRDKLSSTIKAYSEDINAIGNLSMALIEIENADEELRNWVLSENNNTSFNSSNYSLHLITAKEALDSAKNVSKKYQNLRDIILASIEDLENRNILINQAINSKEISIAKKYAVDRRSISSAMNLLSSILRESRHDMELLQAKLQIETKTLDISLTIIITAMIIASIFLALLWSKLVALH